MPHSIRPSHKAHLSRFIGWAAVLGLVAAAFTAAPSTGFAAPRQAAQAPLGQATIAARQHYFGIDNVNPQTGAVRSNQVILSWTGQAGFAAALNGHVVLLDAWVAHGPANKGPSVAYVGTTPDELAALAPEAVFVGHNHFDHVGHLPQVVRANPGVTVVDSSEGCANLEAAVTDVAVNCLAVFHTGPQRTSNGQTDESPFGSVAHLDQLLPGVAITAIRHPHSGPAAGETSITAPENTLAEQQYPCVSAGDCGPDYSGPTSGAISIMYQFRIANFGLTWHNTSGQISDTPVAQVLADLPPTSVEIGSIVSVGGNGVLGALRYVSRLKPKVFIPMHTDEFPSPSVSEYYRPFLLQALAQAYPNGGGPQVQYLSAPGNYLQPMSFDPHSSGWAR